MPIQQYRSCVRLSRKWQYLTKDLEVDYSLYSGKYMEYLETSPNNTFLFDRVAANLMSTEQVLRLNFVG